MVQFSLFTVYIFNYLFNPSKIILVIKLEYRQLQRLGRIIPEKHFLKPLAENFRNIHDIPIRFVIETEMY